MSTVDHLISACGTVRTAWANLTVALQPGRARRVQRALSPAGQARQDHQAAAERADRHAVLTSGMTPTGASPAPLNVTALDTRTHIATEVDSAAWVMASGMAAAKFTVDYQTNKRSDDDRFTTALDWISQNAPRLTDAPDQGRPIVNAAYKSLAACTDLARAIAGDGPDRRPMATECPACGRRSLAWDTSSSNYVEWHVVCTSPKCRCAGRDCPCKLPDRQPGMVHVWLEAGWSRLAEQLNQETR